MKEEMPWCAGKKISAAKPTSLKNRHAAAALELTFFLGFVLFWHDCG